MPSINNEYGETVSCRDDQETKDAVWDLVVKFFLDGGYTHECIYQCDSAQIDGLKLLVQIAKKLEVKTEDNET